MFYSYNLSLLYSLLDFFISIFIQRMCKGGNSHHTWLAHNFPPSGIFNLVCRFKITIAED